MNKNIYKGLHQRKSYDEHLDDLFNHQPISKYPNRVAIDILEDYEILKQEAK
jgi:hypothetical protein